MFFSGEDLKRSSWLFVYENFGFVNEKAVAM